MKKYLLIIIACMALAGCSAGSKESTGTTSSTNALPSTTHHIAMFHSHPGTKITGYNGIPWGVSKKILIKDLKISPDDTGALFLPNTILDLNQTGKNDESDNWDEAFVHFLGCKYYLGGVTPNIKAFNHSVAIYPTQASYAWLTGKKLKFEYFLTELNDPANYDKYMNAMENKYGDEDSKFTFKNKYVKKVIVTFHMFHTKDGKVIFGKLVDNGAKPKPLQELMVIHMSDSFYTQLKKEFAALNIKVAAFKKAIQQRNSNARKAKQNSDLNSL